MRSLLCLFPVFLALAGPLYAATADVTVVPSVQYQTILGWGASSWCPPHATQMLRDRLVREAVDDLGLTRLRLELPSGNRSNTRAWEWLNDDGDPHNTNWAGFNTGDLDSILPKIVFPFKQRVESNGDPFQVYVSPSFFNSGSTGQVPAWLLYSPGEYAEFATAMLLELANAHGVVADYYCILNEAGNNNPFSAQIVGSMIHTLGPWLDGLGLATEIQFPECVNANTSWNYIQSLQSDTLIWPHIGLLTYHLYGTNDPYRSYIRDFGLSVGLPTGQTEFMNLNMDHMYDDLTLGGVSIWEVYGQGQWIRPNYDETSFTRSARYWDFRQVMHYVRPGDVRIEAVSSDPSLRPLAFSRFPNTTLVLLNCTPPQQPCTVYVSGLTRGRYGVCQSVASGVYQEMGPRTIGSTEVLTVNVPANTITTIYPLPRLNQPPVLTDWRASPSYLIQPASSTLLSSSFTDPELDSVSCLWSVKSQPGGASVILVTPGSSSTSATGLTAEGEYIFTITVDDGSSVSARDVVLNVHATNQPPGADDVHNRIPVMVTLPVDTTLLRAWAWDLEGDPLTYLWSVISQPGGASVVLSNANSTSCTATSMSIAGDYVFEFSASDQTHTVSETLTVPVYPLNAAPVIDSAGANPDSLVLPGDSTLLWGATRDPDGDTITHWWSVKTAPPGACPIFDMQGHAQTRVWNLIVPGSYTFTLTVIDMTKHTTRDVTLAVFVGVEETGKDRLPNRFALSQGKPNPFGSATTIYYTLAEDCRVDISIHDVRGRVVRRVVRGEKAAGSYTVRWDGSDGNHTGLPNGVYFIVLKTNKTKEQTRKVVLLR